MEENLKQNISSSSTWGRLLFMLLFAVIYSVAELVLGVVVIMQFIFVLFSGEKNPRLLHFGLELSMFIYQIFLFLTFNRENKPYPFDQWPTSDADIKTQSKPETKTGKAPIHISSAGPEENFPHKPA
jgi:hypothetical protein